MDEKTKMEIAKIEKDLNEFKFAYLRLVEENNELKEEIAAMKREQEIKESLLRGGL